MKSSHSQALTPRHLSVIAGCEDARMRVWCARGRGFHNTEESRLRPGPAPMAPTEPECDLDTGHWIWTGHCSQDLHGIMSPQPCTGRCWPTLPIAGSRSYADETDGTLWNRITLSVVTALNQVNQEKYPSLQVTQFERFLGNPNKARPVSLLCLQTCCVCWVPERSRDPDCWCLIVSSFQKSLRHHGLYCHPDTILTSE